MKHSNHLEELELTPSIRHHHRHRHKQTEATIEPLIVKEPLDHIFDRLNVPPTSYREKTLFDRNLVSYDMVALEERQHDWFNTSKELGELKEKKHQHWPIKREAVIEGDLVLGGLMMVHERSDNMTCGPVMPQGGVQAVETMLYTLDIINNKLKLIPGVKIGAHILDDCDRDTYGLEMAVDFIKGSISNIDDAEYACNATAVRKVISGVVGAASSVTSVQVANLLRLFKIPQVSFFSTSPELSNKARFEYFTRTIPSDMHQVRAMVKIVTKLGWSYVSIIYEESSYGIKFGAAIPAPWDPDVHPSPNFLNASMVKDNFTRDTKRKHINTDAAVQCNSARGRLT
ncbi:jg24029 [Pararge aegeria aegeria]|uniref:Jg24029 protein n=1 Tax=Pararge aegeria aegeria TaxID=348720 RepID=A0A8S4RCP4_9NEOP|nr:jg24029 [Pararge aegeria aegeria]